MSDANLPTPIITAAIAGAVALLVAAITGGASLCTLALNTWLTGRRERNSRRREIFSKAFTVAVAYEEFPYVVWRRRKSDPEGERIRISTELRKVQEDISYYSAWLFTESRHVSGAYEALILKLREIAGKEIHVAWKQQAIDNDTEMNMPDLGLGALKPFKQAYLLEVADHLSPLPRWIRRVCRTATSSSLIKCIT